MRHQYCLWLCPVRQVSIPGGFSWSLRLYGHSDLQSSFSGFQSLAGFLGRCDLSSGFNPPIRLLVSIPGGFSWSLRRSIIRTIRLKSWVSIPGGFSWSLRLRSVGKRQAKSISFNPWRVFLVVATIFSLSPNNRYQSFNPWRVFLVVATLRAVLGRHERERFQSLAGFLGRCDMRGF